MSDDMKVIAGFGGLFALLILSGCLAGYFDYQQNMAKIKYQCEAKK